MLRKLKAIYLAPVFLIVLIGAGFALYHFMLLPQMDKVKKAQEDWKSSRDAAMAEEPKYVTALTTQVEQATKLINDYYAFHSVQNQMPQIYNMKELYSGREKEGLLAWYKTMGTGKMINELSRWSKGFHLQVPHKYLFTGTLGYEDTLPGVKMIGVDFGKQTFHTRGYANLIQMVEARTGYGFFPLIITGSGDALTITVNRNHPRHTPEKPVLSMDYTARAYFMTRGWDPNTYTQAQTYLMEAKGLVENPPQPKPKRTAFDKPCPPILFVIQPKGVEP
jgi:hypothetical protein